MSPCQSYAVCSLKLLGYLGKTEASIFLSFIISFFLFLSVSFFSPNFHKELISSLSLVRPKNSTKSVLYLVATNEQVLDLEELDVSKEDLESGVYRITM